MFFRHSPEIWREFPELAAGAILVPGITPEAEIGAAIARFLAVARSRIADGSESGLAEIQAWRRAYSKLGLKPTQYRSAAEALLRRLRQDGTLPRIHPMIDLCNAISAAFAIPIAVFDRARIADHLEVRHARGSEDYLTFSGAVELPETGEVIFADGSGRAHARRWTNRQSGYSAVRPETREVLIVAEALHDTAAADIERLVATAAEGVRATWRCEPRIAVLTPSSPRFEL